MKAFRALGKPEAVKLFFDVAASRIGAKAAPPGPKTFEMVRRTDGEYGYAGASSFCRHYAIRLDETIEFQDVRVDADGVMVLDLKTARRLRR